MKKSAKKMDMCPDGECMPMKSGYCHPCHAVMKVVLGVLILLNVYTGYLGWWAFVGWVLVVAGVVKFFVPACGHC